MLIGIGHKKRFGKDTIADYLVSKHGFVKIAFADSLKEAAAPIFGLTEAQLYGDLKEVVDPLWDKSPRELMNQLGELSKSIDKKVWIKSVEKKVKPLLKAGKNVVVSDMRFFPECDFIKHNGGVTWNVRRHDIFNVRYSNFEQLQYRMFGRLFLTKQHVSEIQLDTYKFDSIIYNSREGEMDHLYDQVDELLMCLHYW